MKVEEEYTWLFELEAAWRCNELPVAQVGIVLYEGDVEITRSWDIGKNCELFPVNYSVLTKG